MTDGTEERPPDDQNDGEVEQEAPKADLILVQVSDDLALAIGSGQAGGLDIQPMLGLTNSDREAMWDAAAVAAGGFNVLASLNPAIESATGLVRLTAETQAALATLTPLTAASGANMGTLVDGAGKFAHSVQWIPTAAGGLSIAAAMGPSVASLAIQMQLRDISKKIETNIELTREVLDELNWNSTAELESAISTIARAWGEAQHLGHVSDHVYREISGKEMEIDKVRGHLIYRMKGHLETIDASRNAEDRRQWMEQWADQCVSDLESLTRVHTAWLAWTAMRIDHVRDDPRHAEMLREAMAMGDDRARQLILALADKLQRELGLIENASSRRVGRLNSAKLAKDRAGKLRSDVARLVPMSDHADWTSHTSVVGDKETAVRVATVTALHESCAVVATAVGSTSAWLRETALILTETELLMSPVHRLLNSHEFDRRYDRQDVRYVRVDTSGRTLDIATTKGFLTFHCPGSDSADFMDFGQVLQSLMHLPQDEIPILASPSDAEHDGIEIEQMSGDAR